MAAKNPNQSILDDAGKKYGEAVKVSSDAYKTSIEDALGEYSTSVAANNDTANQEWQKYINTVNNLAEQRAAQVKNAEEENKTRDKKNDRLRFWGGVAEAASSLVNVIGTMHGAGNQQWQSPQQEWARRADDLRRERDARLENYRRQLESLQIQQGELSSRYAQNIANQNNALVSSVLGARMNAAGAEYNAANDLAKTNLGLAQAKVTTAQGDRRLSIAGAQSAGRTRDYTQEQIFRELSAGYDRKTGKWWNPATQAYDLAGNPNAYKKGKADKPDSLTGDDLMAIREVIIADEATASTPEGRRVLRLLGGGPISKDQMESLVGSSVFTRAAAAAGYDISGNGVINTSPSLGSPSVWDGWE